MKRKAISKKTRKIVYDKFNGHCAYCGCVLSLKDMQVDHVIPVVNVKYGKNTEEEVNDISNLFPSCRLCN